MDLINLTATEKAALDAIDEVGLDRLIDDALRNGHPAGLRGLPLGSCGPFVSNRFRIFEQALSEFDGSKSAAKRDRTEAAARKAGRNLSHAVSEMKHRKDEEELEGKLFYVEDRFIHAPLRGSKAMSVTISYRWRRAEADSWNHGHITFEHVHAPRPDYLLDAAKRKQSASRRRQDEEDELYRTWERLRDSALYSVRDFFKEGGDGGKVPRNFKVTVDAYSGGLNNRSTEFWLSDPAAT